MCHDPPSTSLRSVLVGRGHGFCRLAEGEEHGWPVLRKGVVRDVRILRNAQCGDRLRGNSLWVRIPLLPPFASLRRLGRNWEPTTPSWAYLSEEPAEERHDPALGEGALE